MNQFMNVPRVFEKEIEQIQKIIGPLMKKTSRYSFSSIMLISFSAINLVPLLFTASWSEATMILIGVLSVLGAVGLALIKEVKHNKAEIQKLGNDYIRKRIEKSTAVAEDRKHRYLNKIKHQPKMGMVIFLDFLNEEEAKLNRETL